MSGLLVIVSPKLEALNSGMNPKGMALNTALMAPDVEPNHYKAQSSLLTEAGQNSIVFEYCDDKSLEDRGSITAEVQCLVQKSANEPSKRDILSLILPSRKTVAACIILIPSLYSRLCDYWVRRWTGEPSRHPKLSLSQAVTVGVNGKLSVSFGQLTNVL